MSLFYLLCPKTSCCICVYLSISLDFFISSVPWHYLFFGIYMALVKHADRLTNLCVVHSSSCMISSISVSLCLYLNDVQYAGYVWSRILSYWDFFSRSVFGFTNIEIAMLLYTVNMHTYFALDIFYQCREVIFSTQKEGEGTARLKQLEVALDTAEIGKRNAETDAALAKEKAEVLKSEIKRIELMVSVWLEVSIAL